MQLFKKSGEHKVKIQRKPELKVYTTEAIAKGELELVSFANTLHVVKGDEKPPPNGMPRAGCLVYEAKGVGYSIFMKPTLCLPQAANHPRHGGLRKFSVHRQLLGGAQDAEDESRQHAVRRARSRDPSSSRYHKSAHRGVARHGGCGGGR